ncbi:hypothetical protein MRB53_038796 [Persea americana]|nr:hypothetical protein MRB53_038796 [Persea americana]
MKVEQSPLNDLKLRVAGDIDYRWLQCRRSAEDAAAALRLKHTSRCRCCRPGTSSKSAVNTARISEYRELDAWILTLSKLSPRSIELWRGAGLVWFTAIGRWGMSPANARFNKARNPDRATLS